MKNISYLLLFLLTSFFFSCEKVGDLNKPDLAPPPSPPAVGNPAIDLTITRDNAAADGVQYNELLFKLQEPAKYSFTEVNFEIAPIGKFTNGGTTQKVPLDINGEARIFATSSFAGPATVRATVGSFSKQSTIQFQTAWPDQIIVEPDSVFLPASPGMKTNLHVKLLRTIGTVSNGLVVQLSDSTIVAHPASVGIFLNTTTSGINGIATSEYWLQNTTYHDYVYLKAIVNTPSGPVRGINRIRIRN